MFYAVIILTFLIFACIILCQNGRQALQDSVQTNRMEARLPKVEELLLKKKQAYTRRPGSTDDDEKEQCAICLVDFSEEANDQVVVLACGMATKTTIE